MRKLKERKDIDSTEDILSTLSKESVRMRERERDRTCVSVCACVRERKRANGRKKQAIVAQS